MACNVSQQQEVIEQEMKAALGKIKHKLLIMSGKGGVGKRHSCNEPRCIPQRPRLQSRLDGR